MTECNLGAENGWKKKNGYASETETRAETKPDPVEQAEAYYCLQQIIGQGHSTNRRQDI